jgi:hypothetical protein
MYFLEGDVMRYLIALFVLSSGAANAAVVSIDAQSYATGTDLSAVAPGATLAEITNYGVASGYLVQPIYTVLNGWATGVGPNFIGHNNLKPGVNKWDFRNVYGAAGCISGGPCPTDSGWDAIRALRISFDVPTNFIEVRAHFPSDAIDGADLRAYNAQHQLIARCHLYGDVPGQNPKYISPTPAPLPGTVCGKVIRRYECNSSGSHCKSEQVAHINLAYPGIAYVLFGSQTGETTPVALSRIRFRRFSEDCAP